MSKKGRQYVQPFETRSVLNVLIKDKDTLGICYNLRYFIFYLLGVFWYECWYVFGKECCNR